jgi:hypothetical protein
MPPPPQDDEAARALMASLMQEPSFPVSSEVPSGSPAQDNSSIERASGASAHFESNPERREQRVPQETTRRETTRDYLGMAESKDKNKKSWLTFIRYFVYFVLGMVMAFILYRSLGVYQLAFQKMGLGAIEKSCGNLTITPFIGSMLSSGCSTISMILGGLLPLLALALCTIFQSLVTLSYFSQGGISGIVTQLRSNLRWSKPLNHDTADTPEIKTLVERHNKISEKAFRKLIILSVVGFIAEAFIVYIARGSGADLWVIGFDTFGFEIVLIVLLFFGSIFQGNPDKEVSEYRSRA